jgi:uncharacterized protein (TIGR00369 family)
MTESGRIINDKLVGFRRLIGLETRELGEGYSLMQLTVGPEHLNSGGTIHGGILATMVDHAGGIAGCYDPATGQTRKAVTISLTTSFLAAARHGTITAVGRKRSGGKRIFAASVEIHDEHGNLLAIGEGSYRYID